MHHELAQILESCQRIEAWQRRFEHLFILQGKALIMTLDELTAQVAANTAVEASAVTLIHGLAEQIAASATDPAKVAALAASLKASADALGAAITANTPAAPVAPPAPLPG